MSNCVDIDNTDDDYCDDDDRATNHYASGKIEHALADCLLGP